MPRLDNFIEDFQKDHSELLNFITLFRSAVASSDSAKAREILTKIENLANGHFSFEETYLYPRLRRLVFEITEKLRRQQQAMREFIKASRSALDKNKFSKNELTPILGVFPKLSKFFQDCNALVFLAEKFNKEGKDDLNRRFKDRFQIKNLVGV